MLDDATSVDVPVVMEPLDAGTMPDAAPPLQPDTAVGGGTSDASLPLDLPPLMVVDALAVDLGMVDSESDQSPGSDGPDAATGPDATGLPPSLVLSPQVSQNFGSATLLSRSPPILFTVTNTGTLPAAVPHPFVLDVLDFQPDGNNCQLTLAAGATCNFSFVFIPVATGPRTGSLVLLGVAEVPLAGTGLAPGALLIDPASGKDFGSVTVGMESPATALKVKNDGLTSVPISQTSVDPVFGNFVLKSDGCTGTTLAPGTDCSLGVSFKPGASGPLVGFVAVYGVAPNDWIAAPLQGIGIGTLWAMPPGLSLQAAVGATSLSQQVVIQNVGAIPNGPLSVTLSSLPGIAGQFEITANGCNQVLAASDACAITIVFKPTSTGQQAAYLIVAGNTPDARAIVYLTGLN